MARGFGETTAEAAAFPHRIRCHNIDRHDDRYFGMAQANQTAAQCLIFAFSRKNSLIANSKFYRATSVVLAEGLFLFYISVYQQVLNFSYPSLFFKLFVLFPLSASFATVSVIGQFIFTRQHVREWFLLSSCRLPDDVARGARIARSPSCMVGSTRLRLGPGKRSP